MKRNYQQHKQEGGGATPSGRFLQPKPAVHKNQGAKRSRQTSLRAFLGVDTPHAAAETPGPGGAGASVPAAWPSTAQRAFENFKLGTPRLPGGQEPASLARQPSGKLLGHGCKAFAGEEDEFRVFSSQTYTYIRRSSQDEEEPHADEEEEEAAATTHWDAAPWGIDTQQAGTTQPQEPATQAQSELVTQDNRAPALGLEHVDSFEASSNPHSTTPLPAQQSISTDMHQVDLGAGLCMAHHAAAATPELAPVHQTGVVDKPGSVGEKPKLFDIFRPKTQRKFLLVVRHGESEYNRAVAESKTYADPMIFDPKLTAKGMQQCKELRRQLGSLLREKAREFGEPLFVVSPLTRAIQTFLESCPWPERLPAAAKEAGSTGTSAASSVAAAPLHIEMLPTISEFMVTAGDVGRPPHVLANDFPQLAEHLVKLPDQWWYQGEGTPSCALSRQWGCAEPTDHKARRVAEFSRWLSSRTERLIVLVGHSSFWYSFTGKQKRMANCEVMQMLW